MNNQYNAKVEVISFAAKSSLPKSEKKGSLTIFLLKFSLKLGSWSPARCGTPELPDH